MNVTKLNISQAARATGVSRGTLYNQIKKGRLSVEKGDDKRVYVDSSELERVYGGLKIEGVPSVGLGVHGGTGDVHGSEVPLEALRAENRMLREQVRKAEERELEARGDARDLLDLMKSQMQLLEAAPGRERRRWRWPWSR